MSSTLAGLADARRRLGVAGSRCTCGAYSARRRSSAGNRQSNGMLHQVVRPAQRLPISKRQSARPGNADDVVRPDVPQPLPVEAG